MLHKNSLLACCGVLSGKISQIIFFFNLMAPKQEDFDDEKIGLVRDFPLKFLFLNCHMRQRRRTCLSLLQMHSITISESKFHPYAHKIYLDPHQILLLLWWGQRKKIFMSLNVSNINFPFARPLMTTAKVF